MEKKADPPGETEESPVVPSPSPNKKGSAVDDDAASSVAALVQSSEGSHQKALLKYIAEFSQATGKTLGIGPPCRSFTSLVTLDTYLEIPDKLKACKSGAELNLVISEYAAFKAAHRDLLAMSKASATRLSSAVDLAATGIEKKRK